MAPVAGHPVPSNDATPRTLAPPQVLTPVCLSQPLVHAPLTPGLQTLPQPLLPARVPLLVPSWFHPDLSPQPVHQPPARVPPWGLHVPTCPSPLSWAWMPQTARPPSHSRHPHGGCRHCWRTCWTPRRFCRTWTSCQPWPCCCPRAPARTGLLEPQPAVLVGRPTAQGEGWAQAPTPQLRRGPRLPGPPPPRTPCRASAPPSCSSGQPYSPSCVVTTGRWEAGEGWRWGE